LVICRLRFRRWGLVICRSRRTCRPIISGKINRKSRLKIVKLPSCNESEGLFIGVIRIFPSLHPIKHNSELARPVFEFEIGFGGIGHWMGFCLEIVTLYVNVPNKRTGFRVSTDYFSFVLVGENDIVPIISPLCALPHQGFCILGTQQPYTGSYLQFFHIFFREKGFAPLGFW